MQGKRSAASLLDLQIGRPWFGSPRTEPRPHSPSERRAHHITLNSYFNTQLLSISLPVRKKTRIEARAFRRHSSSHVVALLRDKIKALAPFELYQNEDNH